ncbi:MAG: c-type cytochrome [Candidatus Kapaibacteriota bacterium]
MKTPMKYQPNNRFAAVLFCTFAFVASYIAAKNAPSANAHTNTPTTTVVNTASVGIATAHAVAYNPLAAAALAADDKASLMAKGEKVYKGYCQTCHQANGQGLASVYPPVAASDYIKKNGIKDVALGVLWGRNGKMTVNGKEYNGVMAAIPSNYTDEDVAGVVTYVMNSWGNPGGTITTAEVTKLRKAGKPKK